jgi:hypothetical protein
MNQYFLGERIIAQSFYKFYISGSSNGSPNNNREEIPESQQIFSFDLAERTFQHKSFCPRLLNLILFEARVNNAPRADYEQETQRSYETDLMTLLRVYESLSTLRQDCLLYTQAVRNNQFNLVRCYNYFFQGQLTEKLQLRISQINAEFQSLIYSLTPNLVQLFSRELQQIKLSGSAVEITIPERISNENQRIYRENNTELSASGNGSIMSDDHHININNNNTTIAANISSNGYTSESDLENVKCSSESESSSSAMSSGSSGDTDSSTSSSSSADSSEESSEESADEEEEDEEKEMKKLAEEYDSDLDTM